MLQINDRIRVPLSDFQWSFVRSGGPGGQNVNKVASKAVLRWDVVNSASLPEDVKARFLAQQRHRLTALGELLVTSQRYRDQERNRQDCLEKLSELLRQAANPPRPRKATRPSRASKTRRLESKRIRSRIKSGRRTPAEE